jgi:hypothetical protein
MENIKFVRPYFPSNIKLQKQLEDQNLITIIDEYRKGKLFVLKYKGEEMGRLEYFNNRWFGGCYIRGLDKNELPTFVSNYPSNYYGAKLDQFEITGFRTPSLTTDYMLWFGYKHYNLYEKILPNQFYITKEQVANDIIAMFYYINKLN